MKFKRLLMAVAAGVCVAIFSSAGAQQERGAIELIKTQVASQRLALVAENLQLTEAESAIFWPVYREFHAERDKLTDRRISMLKEFRDNFDGLSEDQARRLLDDYIRLQDDFLKLRKKYLRNFRAVLSEKRTLRYFQIENKLDTIIEYELTQVVPLAE